MNANTVKLSFKEKFGYSLGDTASNLYWSVFVNFLFLSIPTYSGFRLQQLESC